MYKADDLEMYSRRENIQVYKVPESASAKDDGENKILEIAETLGITFNSSDLQRAQLIDLKKSH